MKLRLCFLLMILVLMGVSACRMSPVQNEVSAEADATIPDEIYAGDAPVEPVASETPPPVPEVPPYDDYQVLLDIDPEARIIKGIERIRYTNRGAEPLEELIVRVYLNAFSENATPQPYFSQYETQIYRNGKDYGYMNILHVSLDGDEQAYELDQTVLRIPLSEPLEMEQTVQIKLQFEAYVPKIAHRIGANDNAFWCGMFLPVMAVHDKDGWHTEPYYPAGDPFYLETANYNVEITTPDGYEVAGSGVKRVDVPGEQKITTFTAGMTRDFAFAVSPKFQVAEVVAPSGVTIQLYYYTETLRVNDILDIAQQGLTYFEQTIGAYPYEQLCIVETDMFVRGMEFSKVIFLDSSFLQRSTTYTNLVHELGHQWFYNMVGNNQMKAAWLDEGLTQFIQEGFFHDTEESLQTQLNLEYRNLKSSLAGIKSIGAKRIAADVSLYDNWTDYYQVQYMKTKMMLYALRLTMGVELFEQFIKEYYKAYSFKIATGEDFIQKAEEVYGESLQDFFNAWINGTDLPELP